MCGITGIFAFNLVGKFNKIHITAATMSMEKRGPDFQDIYIDEWVGLGHRRLSIIDTSEKAHQPMWDSSGRYCIIYNGEIFNYRDLRKELADKGVTFLSDSDTEVLLHLFIREQEGCLSRLNGFFAFCIYDKEKQSFFIARDRYGVKPLLYLFDEDKFIFASEMKTLLQYGIDRAIDLTSLTTYLQLNYIPAPHSIFQSVRKLLPGHYIKVSSRKLEAEKWYDIPFDPGTAEANPITYNEAKVKFADLLEKAVQRRLSADVPLGTFLSGGVDSSVVTGLASRHKSDLHTFSIGFREKFFDETPYANLVAKHFKTAHTVFTLSNEDLLRHVDSILDYIDEPFADSSAINVFILSKETRKHATVALSGDGADELLAGYNKHEAFERMIHPGWKEKLLSLSGPLWRALPQSRNNPLTNRIRQAHRFARGAALEPAERYWLWATFTGMEEAVRMLTPAVRERFLADQFEDRKASLLKPVLSGDTINHVLLNDIKLVLPNDMLVKVDSMSMANGLEIRSPFLDYQLVDFAFSLPASFKIRAKRRKRILQDAFRDMLPRELYNRPKKGFEVPLLKWFRQEMKSVIVDDLLSQKRIEEQGLFDYAEIARLTKRLFSKNPGDVHARIWGLIVFQRWYQKYGS
ncbi:MAG: asparagine synthase (glutamine-hydrolyzing) [Bacteroidota bacterium]|nr:asparagine synthase (glutamine-hydrolyzing) [Bacteroidota bacterium]